MTTGKQNFDLLLVVDYFRSATPYLCLIEALSVECRIGLYVLPLSEELRSKTGQSQDAFVAECLSRGATLVEGEAETLLMIVQQRPYEQDAVDRIKSHITARRTICLMSLAAAGLDAHDACLRQFGIGRAYVPSKRFMDYLLDTRDAHDTWRDIDVVQVGMPYAEIPLFTDFSADWIIASPTTYSFRNQRQIQHYLRTVLALLDQIGGDHVVYKPHNGDQRDYLASRPAAAVAKLLQFMPGAETGLRLWADSGLTLSRDADRMLTALLHARLIHRSKPLSGTFSADWISLEALLPRVRKGVIGGLSNTIWGTLYFGLPFYNCVDRDARDREEPDVAGGFKRSDIHLDVNLGFFEVPYCNGRLDRPGKPETVIKTTDLEGSLIATVRDDILQLRSLAVA